MSTSKKHDVYFVLYILYMPGRRRARGVRPDAGEQFSLLLIPPPLFSQTAVSVLVVEADVDPLAGFVDNDLRFGIKSLFYVFLRHLVLGNAACKSDC